MFKLIKFVITLTIFAVVGYGVWFNFTVAQPARSDDRIAYTRDAIILQINACRNTDPKLRCKTATEHDVLLLAEQGNLAAQVEAARLLFEKAKTDPKEYTQAVTYLQIAAGHGIPAAQNAYGVVYMKGLGGVSPDKLEAYKWFNLAAGRGMDMAGHNLIELSHEITVNDIADAEKRTDEWLMAYLKK